MLTNDILRRVRYALDLNDSKVVELFALTEYKLDEERLKSMFTKDDNESFVLCPDEIAHRFGIGNIAALGNIAHHQMMLDQPGDAGGVGFR